MTLWNQFRELQIFRLLSCQISGTGSAGTRIWNTGTGYPVPIQILGSCSAQRKEEEENNDNKDKEEDNNDDNNKEEEGDDNNNNKEEEEEEDKDYDNEEMEAGEEFFWIC